MDLPPQVRAPFRVHSTLPYGAREQAPSATTLAHRAPIAIDPRRSRRRSFVAVVITCSVGWLCCVATAVAVTIPTVPVGNPGNANFLPLDGYGGVSYLYRIGTYEVTVGQYAEFLNAVAATDTYSLYNPSMASDLNIAGIARSGDSGSYAYNVIGSPNKPVTYVSWGDAARFANWLHNGQPTGLQDASTTEDGAYIMNGAVTDVALNAVTRNPGAQWFIPSQSEWVKAAYHKNDGVTGNYWSFPTATNSNPDSDQPPGSDAPVQSNTANLNQDDGFPNGYDDGYAVTGTPVYSSSQNYLTDVGAYTTSLSAYGTFDQGGNVAEWNEGLVDGSLRAFRGGSWATVSGDTVIVLPRTQDPTLETSEVGFRVATVPEPSTLALATCAGFFLLAAAGRRRRSAFER